MSSKRRTPNLLAAATLGHFLNDFYVSFLPPLLPAVVAKYQLSLALAGLLATILNTSASVTQPIFGIFADRLPRRWFLALGPLMSILGMALLPIAPSYEWMVVALLMAGIGTAIFHPQAASTAGQSARRGRAAGLAFFVSGGELGYATGPIVISLVVAAYGLAHASWVALPGFVLAGALLVRPALTRIVRAEEATVTTSLWGDLRACARPLGLLWLVVAARSTLAVGLITYIPLVLRDRGESLVAGGFAIFVLGSVGAIGGMMGGLLADRFGRRFLLGVSFLISTPCFYLFLGTTGPMAYVLLALGGLTLFASGAVTIVMAQEILPHRASVASSIVMGLAQAVSGIVLTPVGALADLFGLPVALTALLSLGIVGLALLPFLPRPARAIP